jgi:putative transcriptional regulator
LPLRILKVAVCSRNHRPIEELSPPGHSLTAAKDLEVPPRKQDNTGMRWRYCALLLAGIGGLFGQSKRPQDLAAGKILVTPHSALDPAFKESVIVLVRYDESGALGLMLNRRTDIPISRALRELKGSAGHSDPIFVGGPVELDTVFAIDRAPRQPKDATGIFGNIYLITGRAALEKALHGASNPNTLRIYLGYCGWGPHQLENEVQVGAWYIFNRSEDLTFDPDPAALWPKLAGEAEGLKARRASFILTRSSTYRYDSH